MERLFLSILSFISGILISAPFAELGNWWLWGTFGFGVFSLFTNIIDYYKRKD